MDHRGSLTVLLCAFLLLSTSVANAAAPRIHRLLREGEFEKAHELLTKRVVRERDANQLDEGNGLTTLHVAAATGADDAVTLLLNFGIPPDLPDSFGRSAIAIAAGARHQEIVTLLLARGASVNNLDRCRGL